MGGRVCALGISKQLRCRRTSGERVRSEFETNCFLQQHVRNQFEVSRCVHLLNRSQSNDSSDVLVSQKHWSKVRTWVAVVKLNGPATAVPTAGWGLETSAAPVPVKVREMQQLNGFVTLVLGETFQEWREAICVHHRLIWHDRNHLSSFNLVICNRNT